MRVVPSTYQILQILCFISLAKAFFPFWASNPKKSPLRDQPQPPATPPPLDLLKESASPFFTEKTRNDLVEDLEDYPHYFADWEIMTVTQLREELMLRKLPVKGNKAELVARLENHDEINAP